MIEYFPRPGSLNLDKNELMQLAINGFEGSWLSSEAKEKHILQVKEYFNS